MAIPRRCHCHCHCRTTLLQVLALADALDEEAEKFNSGGWSEEADRTRTVAAAIRRAVAGE